MNGAASVCGACQQHRPPFQRTLCATIYQSPASLWVHELKFGGRTDRAAVLASAMLPLLSEVPGDVPMIAMPLHTRRLRSRGYNQALEVVRLIARWQQRPYLNDVLIRSTYTAMQAELSEKERRSNVRGAFTVRKPIGHRRILLVDDVMTTGQTMQAASQCLRDAGVEQVDALVFARSG